MSFPQNVECFIVASLPTKVEMTSLLVVLPCPYFSLTWPQRSCDLLLSLCIQIQNGVLTPTLNILRRSTFLYYQYNIQLKLLGYFKSDERCRLLRVSASKSRTDKKQCLCFHVTYPKRQIKRLIICTCSYLLIFFLSWNGRMASLKNLMPSTKRGDNKLHMQLPF